MKALMGKNEENTCTELNSNENYYDLHSRNQFIFSEEIVYVNDSDDNAGVGTAG